MTSTICGRRACASISSSCSVRSNSFRTPVVAVTSSSSGVNTFGGSCWTQRAGTWGAAPEAMASTCCESAAISAGESRPRTIRKPSEWKRSSSSAESRRRFRAVANASSPRGPAAAEVPSK